MPDRYERMPDAARLVLSCKECGAVVWDREVHDRWHASQEPKEANE